MIRSLDEIEFRRIASRAYADERRLRDALDIEVNGRSLSHALDAVPFDAAYLIDDSRWLTWSQNGADVAILNCSCGEIGCGGFIVHVASTADTVEWRSESPQFVGVFDRAEFEAALRKALAD